VEEMFSASVRGDPREKIFYRMDGDRELFRDRESPLPSLPPTVALETYTKNAYSMSL
jgi:hypothetical protein